MICLDSTFLKLWNRACTVPSAAGWGNLLTELYQVYEGIMRCDSIPIDHLMA